MLKIVLKTELKLLSNHQYTSTDSVPMMFTAQILVLSMECHTEYRFSTSIQPHSFSNVGRVNTKHLFLSVAFSVFDYLKYF